MRQTYSFLILAFLLVLTITSCNNSNKKLPDNQNNEELTSLNEAIAKDGKNAALYTKRGEYYQSHELLNNAMNDINKALSINPKDTKAYIILSELYLTMAKPQESLDALKKVLLYDKQNTDVLISMSKLYLVMKDYENCAKSIETALQINPKLADAYYVKGMALMENEKMNEALHSFQMAIGIDQKHFDALMQLGYIFESRDQKMSIEYFKSAALARPKAIEPLYNAGLLYQENNQPDKAIDSYNSILKIDSTNKLATYNIGYVNLVYKSDYKKAETSFAKTVKLDSLYADAWYNLGYSKELQNNYTSARNNYKQVLKLRVNDPKAIEALNRLDKLERK